MVSWPSIGRPLGYHEFLVGPDPAFLWQLTRSTQGERGWWTPVIIFRLPWKIQEFYQSQDKQQVIGEVDNFRCWNDLAYLGQCDDVAAGFKRNHGMQLEKWMAPITKCVLFLTHILMPM